ncbi:hypothetical protein AVEN_116074-1 [Araneus ventricosus]|uniref:Uncharacterized protein n=1 Tax=Araneus ventricosus TaxID=182803 RepID=A0A4Y2SD22_ARAVE|nr:hypothetical protein AVEN_116074-1 [Araneus ventricosus]
MRIVLKFQLHAYGFPCLLDLNNSLKILNGLEQKFPTRYGPVRGTRLLSTCLSQQSGNDATLTCPEDRFPQMKGLRRIEPFFIAKDIRRRDVSV